MEAVDQEDQAVDKEDQVVDQAVQTVDPYVQVEEYMENNADEAINLQLDFDSDVDDLYMCIDCDDDPACDFTEEEPHSDAKRKLAEWAANRLVSHSALSELLAILLELGLDVPKDPRTLLSTVKDCTLHRTEHDELCRMPSFSVVEFVDEIDPDGCKKVDIIPSAWFEGTDGKLCWWPPATLLNVTKAVKEGTPPAQNWILCNVHVMGNAATYAEARVKLHQAEYTSDLTDIEDAGCPQGFKKY
ncbi:hypothetical protein PFLUV_G00227010 [Perca fluviatilis]|uniref:Uncharacterized protein n=1 Tax=Perca fluviatilis TaxID=8168 RepID=A0A6A5E660_PERFL|nr:hypothetical protein PFLUV_G00227010 [Perca fluviatilis]